MAVLMEAFHISHVTSKVTMKSRKGDSGALAAWRVIIAMRTQHCAFRRCYIPHLAKIPAAKSTSTPAESPSVFLKLINVQHRIRF